MPSQPDIVAIEAWRSLKLYIQVRFFSSHPLSLTYMSWWLTFESFAQPNSVHTIQDALALLSQPQPVQVGPSSSSEGSQEVLLEALPPVLVLHLERFLYDVAADGIAKINKPVQFSPELEIPPRTIISFVFPGQG